MDRTAWIAVVLCAVALVLWQVYTVKQTQNQRAIAAAASPLPSASVSVTPLAASALGPSVAPTITATPQPAPSVAGFAEATETLKTADVELHLTNRGGGIAEVVLPNHLAENERHVVLN